MSDEIKSINNFDYNLICEYFSNIKRQGPGSTETTVLALNFIDKLTEKSCIADIGCGTGSPTLTLAQNTPGHITAIDLFPRFIEKLRSDVASLHLQDKVECIVGSMENLPFKNETFDVIWSEGAIYNVGFERGLNEWRRFIKKNGYIAVSEASWFTEKRPKEINQFWEDAYPEIDTIPNKVAQMQKAGYIPVATFILPENCWTDNYYSLQEPIQEAFLNMYTGNKTAEDLIANLRHEAQMYNKYKAYYGYVFYIGQKI